MEFLIFCYHCVFDLEPFCQPVFDLETDYICAYCIVYLKVYRYFHTYYGGLTC
jgi:hypothetical protein